MIGLKTKSWEQMFGESEDTEEKHGVEGVTGEGVAEEGQARDVAGGEAGGSVRVGAEELPDSEIGDEEELERSEKNGAANSENAAPIRKARANQHAKQETGVNNGNEAMEADEEIAREEGHERKKKGHSTVAKHRPGEKRHRPDGSEIPRMRNDAKHGGKDDHYRGENGTKNKDVGRRFFLEHDSNQTSSAILGNT
jgi:hypothetical protein